VTIEQRIQVLEEMAGRKGVDISTDLAAVQRRVQAIEQRLHHRSEHLAAQG